METAKQTVTITERHAAARAKALFYRIAVVVLLLFASWSAFVIAYPVAGNGWMYRIKQPAPVILVLADAQEPRVLLRLDRYAMWAMEAQVYQELHCDSVQELPPFKTVLEAGRGNFVKTMPFLQAAINGTEGVATCHYVGLVIYRPFGDYGPKITYGWLSEEFSIDRGLAE